MAIRFTGPSVTAINQNLDVKASVRAASTTALAAYTRTGNVITANANGALAAIDGVTLVAADRLLLKDGAAGADNGIYDVTQVGTASLPYILTRSADADASSKVTTGMFTFVEAGTVNGSNGFVLTTANPITLNTTPLTFTQFTGAGQITAGAGISKSGNTISVAAAQTTITSITAPTGAGLVLANTDAAQAVTVTSGMRSTGSGMPSGAGGAGAEVLLSGGTALFQGNNRTSGAWVPVGLQGSTAEVNGVTGNVTVKAANTLAGTFSSTGLALVGGASTTAPAGASAHIWKLGSVVAGAVALDATRSAYVDINGSVVKVLLAA